MAAKSWEDPRVRRTRRSIHEAFRDMLSEMNYEKITVQELARRAGINRKTFYLHYSSLDELMRATQTDLAREFLGRTRNMNRTEDMDEITKAFFQISEELGPLGEKLICADNYRYISQWITRTIMQEAWELDASIDKKTAQRRILAAFISQGTLAAYRQWVADGRFLSLEEVAEFVSKIVTTGVNGVDGETD